MLAAFAERPGDGVIAFGLDAVDRGRCRAFFKAARHGKAEPTASGREKDMIDARFEFGIEFISEGLDALHAVGADGKRAYLEGPTGSMTERAKVGKGIGGDGGIDPEAADAVECGSIGEHLAELAVGSGFDDGEMAGDPGDGAGGGEGGSSIAAGGGEALRLLPCEKMRDSRRGKTVFVRSGRIGGFKLKIKVC